MTDTQDRLEERLAAVLDQHEMMTTPLECSCEEWSYRDERPGNYFRDHQARAVAAALRQSQDIEAAARRLLAWWDTPPFVSDGPEAVVEALRAALAPKAEEAPR